MKIVIIEDNSQYREMIVNELQSEFVTVQSITEFTNIYNQVVEVDPDLIILDYYLPETSSIQILSELKPTAIPVVVLTSNNIISDEIEMFELGAIDFINKDRPIEVIKTRINRMLNVREDNSLTLFDITLNRNTMMINNQVKLTKNEFMLLQVLIEGHGEVVSQDQMKLALWQEKEFVGSNTLTVSIGRVRDKLVKAGCKAKINTVRGKGYYIDEAE